MITSVQYTVEVEAGYHTVEVVVRSEASITTFELTAHDARELAELLREAALDSEEKI